MKEKINYEEIIGGTEEEKKAAFKKLQIISGERDEQFAKHELEKTPEDLEIIQMTEAIVDKMVAQYGGDPKPFPLDHIYILKPGDVLTMTGGRISGGIYKPLGRKIGIEKSKSKLMFASKLAHELFHAKAYKSFRVGKTGEDVRLYRNGILMIDRKDFDEEIGEEKEYFAILEDAIIAECVKKFLDEIGKESIFSEETEAIKKFRDWVVAYYRRVGMPEEKIKEAEKEVNYIDDPYNKVEKVLAFSDVEEKRQAYAAGMFNALYEKGSVETLERYKERRKLYEFIDKLVAESNGKFRDRNEVFDEIAKANFSGKYLPLARIVESILGRGAFRKMAEEFGEEPKK